MLFYNGEPVKVLEKRDGWSYCNVGFYSLKMWLPDSDLHPEVRYTDIFTKNYAQLLSVDSFYTNPDKIRNLALNQDYNENIAFYKGKRTKEKFLWPSLKERFEFLLRRNIVDWLEQPANGCFQITNFSDPLVWHSDSQHYAAAIYLTPNPPLNTGTSFWKSKIGGCRRPPGNRYEIHKFPEAEERKKIHEQIYNSYNYVNPDNWELVDSIGAVYNRLVIWDAQLIHSASSYQGMAGNGPEDSRLVQLFFFNVA